MGLGTRVSVAGVFAYNVLGTLSVKYTVDGVASTQNYSVTPTTPEYTSGVKQRNNFFLFGKNSLAAGDHTLVMQIMDCVNQTFELDFILYTPSFSSLASRQVNAGASQPSLQSPGQTSPTISSTQANSTSTSNNLLTSVPSSTFSSSSSQFTKSTTVPQHLLNSNTNTKTSRIAIIAGAVGGIGILLLLSLILCRKKMLIRRASSHSRGSYSHPQYLRRTLLIFLPKRYPWSPFSPTVCILAISFKQDRPRNRSRRHRKYEPKFGITAFGIRGHIS